MGAGRGYPLELISNYSTDSGTDSTTSFSTDGEKRVLSWLNGAYEEAKFGLDQSEEVKLVERYINYLMGRQWPTKRPAYKAAPVDNRLWKIMEDYVAYLTDVRPTWDITAGNKAYIQTSTLLKSLTDQWWLAQNVDIALGNIIIYGLLTTGYGMLKWNDTLCGGKGDMELRAVGPADLMPLRPQGLDTQSCQGLIHRSIKPLSWFRKKYGNNGWRVQADPSYSMGSRGAVKPSYLIQGAWDLMSPGMRKIIGIRQDVAQSVFPMAEYREIWVKDEAINTGSSTVYVGEPLRNWSYKVAPGAPLYPRGRLMITGGTDVLLYDGPNPFWHGRFPFEKLCLNNVPWQWHGPSEFRVQIPLQDVVNQVFAGVLDVVKKAVNPVLLAAENSFSASVRQSMDPSMPGAKLFFNPNATSVAPALLPPPVLPGYVMDLMVWAMREMDNHSGILDLNSISKMGQIPAADTLEQLKEGQQTVIRLKGRYIEEFLRNIGTQAISNFFQFYTMERRIRILGEDGITFQDLDFDPRNMIPEGFDPQLFAQTFSFSVLPGSSLSASRVQRAGIANMLRGRGDMDRRTVLDLMGFGPQADTIEKNLRDEGKDILTNMVKAQMARQGGGGGGPAMGAANVMSGLQGAAGAGSSIPVGG